MKKIMLLFALMLVSIGAYAQNPRNQDRYSVDWAAFKKYKEANAQVTTRPKVLFIGDSITEFWVSKRPDFFSANNFLGRGISGQVPAQILARFQQDAIDLKPEIIVILCGINDIAGNNGAIEYEDIVAQIKSMCEIAKANGIMPIVCSLLPCDNFFWRPDFKPAGEVVKLNALLEKFVKEAQITYVDYFNPMNTGNDSLSKEDSEDGCHPTAKGYEKMEEIVMRTLSPLIR